MNELRLPEPDLRALATGEIIVTFQRRGSAAEGDEVGLVGSGSRPFSALKPAYRRWADLPAPAGRWSAIVIAVHPAAMLDPDSGASRHILAAPPTGDLLVLRVAGPEGVVLSDEAFAARRRSLEGALAG